MEFKNSVGNTIKMFANTIEQSAIDQVKRFANFEPYANQQIRIMPDAHTGKGCTIGTTMTVTDCITPNLVGVDIGCGMLTVELDATDISYDMIDSVIRKFVPSGNAVHQHAVANFDLSKVRCLSSINEERAIKSIGTLGGGNHFIEIARSEQTGKLYLIIHSGSRQFGLQIANHYQKLAETKCKIDTSTIIEKLKSENRHSEIQDVLTSVKEIPYDLAYISGSDMQDYLNDMNIAVKYASLNRRTMSELILKHAGLNAVSSFETIHNYIDMSDMILRKGAVSAKQNEKILIPINMRDGSLVCIGKGNADWNYSGPHGAGRLMSRSKAKEQIDIRDFQDSMRNVFSTSVCKSTLDEAPQAYKPISEIIDAIEPTATIVDMLKPEYNFKSS